MEPFLKWAGGKRWLTTQANCHLPERNSFKRYFEPFLGSGAVFFYLQPQKGNLSDVNVDLINSYLVIRDNWKNLYKVLSKYNRLHCKEFYYQLRASKPRTDLQKAARFIYLNRTCWNGLYRVNQKGVFNVPIGTKTKVILDADNFEQLSVLLNELNIEACDFERTIDQASVGDFVFIDPPYTVKHNLNGFIKYNETLFSWEDQVRLRNAVKRAVERGASVLVLNAHHKSITELYKDMGKMSILNRASVIAGNSNARGLYSELAIKCG
jgi:DNA adenine methylase